MRSDRDYIRIYALINYIEIISRENHIEPEPESFAKLSLLCYDDNDDIKRVLFAQLMNKKNKKTNALPSQFSLYSVFFHFSDNENLKFIANDVFTKDIDRLADDYMNFISKTKKEDITRSPEYLFTYLYFLMANNPLLLLGAKTISYHTIKCIDYFISTINRNQNPNRGEYFMIILEKLRDHPPMIYKECSKTSIEFTDIKVKKIIKKAGSVHEEPKTLTHRDILDFLINHFKAVYGANAVNTKRLPVTLPQKLYHGGGLLSLHVPLGRSLMVEEPTFKEVNDTDELPVKKLDFGPATGMREPVHSTATLSRRTSGDKKEKNTSKSASNKKEEELKKETAIEPKKRESANKKRSSSVGKTGDAPAPVKKESSNDKKRSTSVQPKRESSALNRGKSKEPVKANTKVQVSAKKEETRQTRGRGKAQERTAPSQKSTSKDTKKDSKREESKPKKNEPTLKKPASKNEKPVEPQGRTRAQKAKREDNDTHQVKKTKKTK